jgi:thiamine-monophosphate kinase
MSAREFERIAQLQSIFESGAAYRRGVVVGIGDDAAVLAGDSKPQVVSVDTQVEGVHFDRNWMTWRDIGYRSLMAAMSDLAAMGASPTCALSALILPREFPDAALFALAEGQRLAADACGCAVAGGNLSRGDTMSVTTTVLGGCTRPVLRSGARVGDDLWRIGNLGFAALGLEQLRRGVHDSAWVGSFRRPRALLVEGVATSPLATAQIDISDGLVQDLAHLCAASGVAAVLDFAALEPAADFERCARDLEIPWLDLVLYGGEDYALLATSPADVAFDAFADCANLRRIGRICSGSGVHLNGLQLDIQKGFQHF